MTETVYPKLMEIMAHNAIDNVIIKLSGANDIWINKDSKIAWKDSDAGNELSQQWKDIKIGSDPGFRGYANSKKIYATENDMYVAHCHAVMNKIDEISKLTCKIDEAIKRAEQISVVYERKVLIEKIIKNDI